MQTKIILVAVSLAVTIPVTGCGSSSASDPEAVRAAFDDLAADLAAGDVDGACEAMTRSAARHVGTMGHNEPWGCRYNVREFLEQLGADAPESPYTPKAVSVSIEGDRATVVAKANGEWKVRLPFVREDGDWKADKLFGISGPVPMDMR